ARRHHVPGLARICSGSGDRLRRRFRLGRDKSALREPAGRIVWDMRLRFLSTVLLLGGCSGGNGTLDRPLPDAAFPDAPILDARPADARRDAPPIDASIAALSCYELDSAIVSRLAIVDGSCETVNDCTAIVRTDGWCDAYPSLILVITKTAAADPDLLALV